MESGKSDTLSYSKSRFKTRLPMAYQYTESHYWLHEKNGLINIGFTKYATRILGEMVDYDFEITQNSQMNEGDIIGWIEGFKASSDIYCILNGHFLQTNPTLENSLELVFKKPYTDGWLYQMKGRLKEGLLNAQGYAEHLNKSIDKILEKQ